MNTPRDHEPEDLRYAEYVLGVLDAEARAAVEREIASDPRAATEVARWQNDLLPLAQDIPAEAPADHVWERIQSRIGLPKPARPVHGGEPPYRGWWNSISLWRGLAFGAIAIAAACIVALVVLPRADLVRPVAPTAYMTSTISRDDGRVGWTATADLQQARIVVIPGQPQKLAEGRAPELWLIPPGHKPIAIGMIDATAPTTIALPRKLLPRIAPGAVLAVSVEPKGGSPTGQPTGPVIGKGPVDGA